MALILSLIAPPALARCGVERWPVKVGTDADAVSVSLYPTQTTIKDLTQLAAPKYPGLQPNNRYPEERQTVSLSATLTLIKREADSDYHLVIGNGLIWNGTAMIPHMIVEAPDPACATNSRFIKYITQVRRAIDQYFGGPIIGRHPVNTPITITGIPFFDKIHDQEGVAPNGIELHPLLSIDFGRPQ
jgi:hypothetical protein